MPFGTIIGSKVAVAVTRHIKIDRCRPRSTPPSETFRSASSPNPDPQDRACRSRDDPSAPHPRARSNTALVTWREDPSGPNSSAPSASTRVHQLVQHLLRHQRHNALPQSTRCPLSSSWSFHGPRTPTAGATMSGHTTYTEHLTGPVKRNATMRSTWHVRIPKHHVWHPLCARREPSRTLHVPALAGTCLPGATGGPVWN